MIFEYLYIFVLFIHVFTSAAKTYSGIILPFRNCFFVEMLLFFIVNIVFEYILKKRDLKIKQFKKIAYIFGSVIFVIGMFLFSNDNGVNICLLGWIVNTISWISFVTILPKLIIYKNVK